MYLLLCISVFLAAYLVNVTTISLFYHRGLAHGALRLGPRLSRFVATFRVWITGLDPVVWVCMNPLPVIYTPLMLPPISRLFVSVVSCLFQQITLTH
mgnify:CR=1 FL=1